MRVGETHCRGAATPTQAHSALASPRSSTAGLIGVVRVLVRRPRRLGLALLPWGVHWCVRRLDVVHFPLRRVVDESGRRYPRADRLLSHRALFPQLREVIHLLRSSSRWACPPRGRTAGRERGVWPLRGVARGGRRALALFQPTRGADMQLETIEDVYAEQLADLRSAETQLLDALPKMARAATEPELKQAFTEHLAETREHLERLEEIIGSLPSSVPFETCEAMQGLIAEGEEVVK